MATGARPLSPSAAFMPQVAETAGGITPTDSKVINLGTVTIIEILNIVPTASRKYTDEQYSTLTREEALAYLRTICPGSTVTIDGGSAKISGAAIQAIHLQRELHETLKVTLNSQGEIVFEPKTQATYEEATVVLPTTA